MRWKKKPSNEAFEGIRRDAKKKESDNFSGSYLSVHFITSAMYGRGSGVLGWGREVSASAERLIDIRQPSRSDMLRYYYEGLQLRRLRYAARDCIKKSAKFWTG